MLPTPPYAPSRPTLAYYWTTLDCALRRAGTHAASFREAQEAHDRSLPAVTAADMILTRRKDRDFLGVAS